MHKSNRQILSKLIVFVKPMLPVMVIAIAMGTIGFLAAILIPVLGAQGVVHIMEGRTLRTIVIAMAACAVLRGVLRYAEQACNHYIAFRLLAHIRDLVFGKLRALSCAKLEGRDKGNFISLITSDVELLEVFYAHTISPVCIALLVSAICVAWQASMHGGFCAMPSRRATTISRFGCLPTSAILCLVNCAPCRAPSWKDATKATLFP